MLKTTANFTENFGNKKDISQTQMWHEYKGNVGSFMGFESLTDILVKIQVFWMLNCVCCKELSVCWRVVLPSSRWCSSPATV